MLNNSYLINIIPLKDLILYVLTNTLEYNEWPSVFIDTLVMELFRRELNMRSIWMRYPRVCMDDNDIRRLFLMAGMNVNFAEKYSLSLASDWQIVDQMVCELTPSVIPYETWHLWSVEYVTANKDSLRFIDEGDYRILEWIRNQEQNNLEFATLPKRLLWINE